MLMNNMNPNEMAPRVVLAGGTGMLGRLLIPALLAAGWQVDVLTRGGGGALPAGVKAVPWDGLTFGSWVGCLDGAAALVNLAGRSTMCRFSEANRREITASRLNTVRALAEAVRRASSPPLVWVQANSVAWYGDGGEAACDEQAGGGAGFCAEVCQAWEREFFTAPLPDVRRVSLRLGFVLSGQGGILKALAPVVKAGLGGAIGHGRQWVSWVHEDDAVKSFLWALQDDTLHGPVVAAAPGAERNAAFMAALRKAWGRPWCPGWPAPLVQAGAWLGGMAAEPLLHGRRAFPAALLARGFRFAAPQLGEALGRIIPAEGSGAAAHRAPAGVPRAAD